MRLILDKEEPFWFGTDNEDASMRVLIDPSKKAAVGYQARLDKVLTPLAEKKKKGYSGLKAKVVSDTIAAALPGTLLQGVEGYGIQLEVAEKHKIVPTKAEKELGYVLLDLAHPKFKVAHRAVLVAEILERDMGLRDLITLCGKEYHDLPEFKLANGIPLDDPDNLDDGEGETQPGN